MKRILSLFVALLFVSGCGGGSGDSNVQVNPDPVDPVEEVPMMEEPEEIEPMEPMEPEVPDPEPEMEEMEPESVSDIPFECPDSDDLVDFLDQAIPTSLIIKLENRPEIIMGIGTTDFQKSVIVKTAGLLNSALPEEYEVTVNTTDSTDGVWPPPNNKIYIDFVPKDMWTGIFQDVSKSLGTTQPFTDSAQIWIDSLSVNSMGENRLIWLISHELLHAMGLTGHIPPANYLPVNLGEEDGVGVGFYTIYPYYSVLWDIIPSEESERLVIRDKTTEILSFQVPVLPPSEFIKGTLYPVDWWGLKYLYEELETGDEPVFGEDAIDEWLMEKGCN